MKIETHHRGTVVTFTIRLKVICLFQFVKILYSPRKSCFAEAQDIMKSLRTGVMPAQSLRVGLNLETVNCQMNRI